MKNSKSINSANRMALAIAASSAVLAFCSGVAAGPALAWEKPAQAHNAQIQNKAPGQLILAEAETHHEGQMAHEGEHAAMTSTAIKVEKAWTRVAPPGSKVAGGFVTLTNTGKSEDRLIGGSFDLAGRVEVHQMSMTNGVMRMKPVAGGLKLAPGATVELKPGSYHLMFLGLKGSPKLGEPVKGTLKFEKAGDVAVSFAVAPLGSKTMDGAAGKSGSGHSGHDMHGSEHNH